MDVKSYKNLTELANEVEKHLSSKDVLIYAFNATGKTRLSFLLDENDYENATIKSLSYNAIVEDYFSCDNENFTFKVITETWLFNFIKDEGLDGDIVETFNSFIGAEIKPEFDLNAGDMHFYISGADGCSEAIKISKGEEKLFQWSVFYSVLKRAVDLLAEKKEDRSLRVFDALKYIVIDDPISSLDDYKVYTLSIQILGLLKTVHERRINIKFLI